jgi:hypothetical protein
VKERRAWLVRWIPDEFWWLPTSLRWAAIISLFLGLTGVVIGLRLDGSAWLDQRPFLTNFASALATGLVGVSVGGVVLSVILERARDARVRGRVQVDVRAALGDMRAHAIRMIGTNLRGRDVEHRLPARRKLLRTVEEFIERRHYSAEDVVETAQVREAVAKLRQYSPDVNDWQRDIRSVRRLWRDVLYAQQVAGLNAAPRIRFELVASANELIASLDDDEYPPAGWGYDGPVDRCIVGAQLLDKVQEMANEAKQIWSGARG